MGQSLGWSGTALGWTVGFLFGGPIGALFGAAVGHGYDRGLLGASPLPPFPSGSREHAHARFFEATFSVMGHTADLGGHITSSDSPFAASVMDRMSLTPGLRRAARRMFDRGRSPGFDLGATITDLRRACDGEQQLLELFLEVQLATAYAQGAPSAAQMRAVAEITRGLGVSDATYRRLERLVLLNRRTYPPCATGGSTLAAAYAVLGVEPAASDAELKHAYRRLMSRHHPDKLASRGLTEEALKLASQKTQEVRRAYEQIARARAA